MDNDIIEEYNGVLDSRYYVPQYSMSIPTSIQTANQLAEATARLNAGVYGIDLALIKPDVLEQVPAQHLKEIDRLVKLSNAKASMHGPIIDLAGFEQGRWEETGRKAVERKLTYYMDKAHMLDEDGNTPINFHINTNVPGDHTRKLSDEEVEQLKKQAERAGEKEREYIQDYIEKKEIKERIGVVDRQTGQVQAIPFEIKHYPGREEFFTPERRLESLNQNDWDDDKLKIFELQRQKAMIEDRAAALSIRASPLIYGAEKGAKLTDREQQELKQYIRQLETLKAHVRELDTHVYSGLNELHHKLSYVPEKDKTKADKFMGEIEKNYKQYDKEIESTLDRLKKVKTEEEKHEIESQFERLRDMQYKELQLKLESVGRGKESVIPLPQRYIPANELAKQKTVETVSNAIYESYKKYKDNTPLLALENYWFNQTLGRASDMNDVVEEARKKFAEKLAKNEGMGYAEALNTAKKLIGVTWDVGHINFMRSAGYSEKEILEETRRIAPYVKQLHITDNFGFDDAHLPPGMGNAPIKKEIEELKKHGFEIEKGNVIVEAGAFPAQFNENPHPYSLEYFDSPLYTMKAGPTWDNIWETQGPYSTAFIGDILPDLHFRELYGAGFSNLPPELGGQRASDRGRFATSGQ